MVSLGAVATRLPIVLVVDPVAATRLALWRLLSRSFGVLEAPDARSTHALVARRPQEIDAIVVQHELPDEDGAELVKILVASGIAAASRAVLVSRPVDLRAVLTSLSRSLFAREPQRAQVLMRQAQRMVS